MEHHYNDSEHDSVALTIDPTDPMSSVWAFFVRWLELLKEEQFTQAFELVDGPMPGHGSLNAESICQLFQEFSQDRGKAWAFRDIVLDGEETVLSKEDSVIRYDPNGAYYAHLWVPLRGFTDEFVLEFCFVPCGNNLYQVLLSGEPLVM